MTTKSSSLEGESPLWKSPPVNSGGFLSNLHSCIQKSGPSELCIFFNICRIKTSNFKDSRDQMTALAFKHLRSVASKGQYCSCIGSLSTFWLHLRGKKNSDLYFWSLTSVVELFITHNTRKLCRSLEKRNHTFSSCQVCEGRERRRLYPTCQNVFSSPSAKAASV